MRHVHVNDGGQAIVADQGNNYAGGAGNAESDKQSHAAGMLGHGSPLPFSDPAGRRVSTPRVEGAKTDAQQRV